VIVNITDKKIAVPLAGDTINNYYTADVINAYDYYPFGAQLPGRVYSTNYDYRFGFNGMEKDDDLKSNGRSYSATFWEYDSRIGARWNVDPMNTGTSSPYAAFLNNPIVYNDPFGLDTVNSVDKLKNIGDVFQHYNSKTNSNFFYNKTANGLEGSGSSQQLADVVFTAKAKPKASNWMGYPNVNKSDRVSWTTDQNIFFERKALGISAVQGGESNHYLSSVGMYER
jgi:RHS repeat-associated protein